MFLTLKDVGGCLRSIVEGLRGFWGELGKRSIVE